MQVHHFTVDVEEYFQVCALQPYVARASWDARDSRVHIGVARLLELLSRHDVRGTFFVLGWIAERHPDLIREIAAAGHEIASHGQDHCRVTHETPERFSESIRRSKAILEELTGQSVLGFRAPSFSIVPGLEWALDLLIEAGYRYDSSLFPIRRRGYGYPGGRTAPYWIERDSGRLYELPPTVLRRGRWNIPAAGGGYFRLLPYQLTRAALRQAERAGRPGTFFIHPWEVDPDQPLLPVGRLTRLRHYGGLRRTMPRLERLLEEFEFGRLCESVPSEG